jgi:membrane-associated phospholipid phosphatase
MYKELLRRFKAFDVITMLYAFATGVILLFASFKLEDIQTKLLIRMTVISLIVILALFLDNKTNPFLKIVRHFYFLPVLLYFISEGDYINNIFFPDLDRYMVNFELTLFSDHPGVVMAKILHFRWFSEFMSLSYLMYYGIFIYFILRIYRKEKEQFDYVVFLINMSVYLIFFIFILCPVAGPQYYLIPPDNQIPEGFFIRDFARWIFLKTDHSASAFPSMNAVLLCFISYLTYRNIRPVFKYVLPLTVLILIASVYLKVHYAVDVIAGLLSFPAIYWMSSRTYLWINNFLGGNVNSWNELLFSIPKMYGKR